VDRIRTEPSAGALSEFTALLRRHIRTEENELFEEAQRVLERDVLDRIGAAIEARVVRVCLEP
jgi:hemerythrin-like domain-containing protein